MSKHTLKKRTQALEEELSYLLYVVSHDLGKYIRHMHEFTAILLEESKNKFNKEELEYADLLMRAAERSQEMIAAILEYSRIESHGEKLEAIDSNALLKKINTALKNKIAQTKARIIIDPLPQVYADKNQLAYIWEQLLLNALTFTDGATPPKIHIQAKEEGSTYVFSIQDNGVGIEEKNFEKIFKLFTRLHLEDKYPGIGSGLAITHKILQRHGGDIWVTSVPKKGATFFFSIPKR